MSASGFQHDHEGRSNAGLILAGTLMARLGPIHSTFADVHVGPP